MCTDMLNGRMNYNDTVPISIKAEDAFGIERLACLLKIFIV